MCKNIAILKKVFLSTFLSALLIGTMPISVYTATLQISNILNSSDTALEDIVDFTKKVSDKIESQYENCLKDLNSTIDENQYNYEMTMASFHEQKKPYANFDFRKLIATYSVIDEYLQNNYNKSASLDDIQFISTVVTPQQITETIPVHIDVYSELDDGRFIRNGSRYIDKKEILPTYAPIDDDNIYFIQNGTQTIKPYERKIQYGQVGFKTISIDDLCSYYNIPSDSINKKIQIRYKEINNILGKTSLNQNVFICTPDIDQHNQNLALINRIISNKNLSPLSEALILTASSLIGQVPYEYNGKPTSAGQDKTWWTFDSNGEQKGLDSFGFIKWTYMTAGFPKSIYNSFNSSASTCKSNYFKTIQEDELEIGDIGLQANTTAPINHIGMYLGDGKWIHCSSETGTVSVTENPEFHVYKKLIYNNLVNEDNNTSVVDNTILASTESESIGHGTKLGFDDEENNEINNNELDSDNNEDSFEDMVNEELDKIQNDADIEIDNDTEDISGIDASNITDSDIQLHVNAITESIDVDNQELDMLARMTQAEAENQGLNGWVAVAEVIMNRVHSPKFPNDVYSVISAPGQFQAYKRAMNYSNPRDDIKEICRQVMAGQLGILNNDNVLYFRNPDKSGGDASVFNGHPAYQTIGNHTFYIDND